MAAALLVVPALAAAWLWVAPRGRSPRSQLLAGGAAMVVVGLAWPVLMWLTPAADRPVDLGHVDNSIWSLIFGYNGLGRLDGQAGGPAGLAAGRAAAGAAASFGGATGPLRLLNEALGGQAGWLLGFALVAGIGCVVASRLRRTDPRTGWLIAVGGAFADHRGRVQLRPGHLPPVLRRRSSRRSPPRWSAPASARFAAAATGSRGSPAPLAIAAGVVAELAVLDDNPGTLAWLAPRARRRRRSRPRPRSRSAATARLRTSRSPPRSPCC